MVEARMERAFLERAIFEGVDLSKADLRSSQWTGANVVAVAYAADFRDSRDLTQAQLNEMIGNVETLLPETLADGTVPSIPSCWAAPPPFFEIMIERLSSRDENRANELRAQFLCPEGTEPARTGTPLALDAPYPDGHPLAERDD